MPSPILLQNSDCSVTLLDIPCSIASAQGIGFDRQLLSSPALQTPFPSNEPKSASAREKLSKNTMDAELHAEYRVILRQALEDVRKRHAGGWCLPRSFVEETPRAAKKRKLEHEFQRSNAATDATSSNERPVLPSVILPCLAGGNGFGANTYSIMLEPSPESQSDLESRSQGHDMSESHLFSNDSDLPTSLRATSSAANESFEFCFPPRASFFLGDCMNARSFHSALRDQANQAETRKGFDLILLDPPWPNRSVKRTHKTVNSTYVTMRTLMDVRDLIHHMDLDMLMTDDCLVGIWITNKPAVRELVLSEDGVFTSWDVELVEEWLWLKTTANGDPVTALDALWRKPYEVLLLGRKRTKSMEQYSTYHRGREESSTFNIKRRVIISVPDLHSRKPCLKELVEPLMRDSQDYRALEVFARHLVTTWWSWGNECIKFNWKGYWKEDKEKPSDVEAIPLKS